MKNILIVLILTGGTACLSGIATFKIIQSRRAAAQARQTEPAPPPSMQEAIRRSQADYAEVSNYAQQRDRNVLIAAGVGGGCGLIPGIALTRIADKKKAAKSA